MDTFVINFEYKMSKRILKVCIEYSMCNLICDVINCYDWSCDIGKINLYDKIMI